MLNLYDKEGPEITNEPAKCVRDNQASYGVVRGKFVPHLALVKQQVQQNSATLD